MNFYDFSSVQAFYAGDLDLPLSGPDKMKSSSRLVLKEFEYLAVVGEQDNCVLTH